MQEIAHPLVGSSPLPVAPAVLAAVTVALVAVVVTRVRASSAPPPGREPAAPRWVAATRALGAAGLLLLLAVARFGPPDEPRNLAAVVTVNLLWPLLLVLAAFLGTGLWRAADPWRALGAVERLAGTPPPGDPPPGAAPAPPPGDPPLDGAPAPAPGAAEPEPASGVARRGDARVAAVLAAAWAFLLVEYAVSLDPRTLATVLAAYTLLLVAGSLAVGRERWLPAADAIGNVVAWTGRLRRGRLRSWTPPVGAAALLGAAFGGIAFARLRLTGWWGRVALSQDALTWTRLAGLAAIAGGAGLAVAASAWARRRGAPGSAEAAFVPLVAALAVATVLRRAMVAAQLVPSLATDPFGRGWRLLRGLADTPPVDVNPWGTAVQQALACGVVAAGALAGAWVLARRVRGVRARDPAAFLLYAAAGVAVLAVTIR